MSEIKIIPIFDQSAPKVWTDFLRIRAMAMQCNHNVKMSDHEIADAITEYQDSWKRVSCNYAFGAFDNGKMVGCVTGDCQHGVSYLRHLYVLPEYQGQYLGYSLLKAAENMSSLYAKKSDIVALPGAEKFYKKYGYVAPCSTNWYTKDICNAGKCSVTPLFYYSKPIIRICNELAAKSGDVFVPDNKQHKPVFIYRDAANKITAFGVVEQNGARIYSQSLSADDWARRCINRAIEKFLSCQKV